MIVIRGKNSVMQYSCLSPADVDKPADDRLAFPNPDQPPFWLTPPSLYIEHDIPWCGISFWLVWVTCPSNSPSQFLLLSLAEHETNKKSLSYYKHNLAKDQNIIVLSTSLILNTKYSIIIATQEWIATILAETRTHVKMENTKCRHTYKHYKNVQSQLILNMLLNDDADTFLSKCHIYVCISILW